MFQVSGDFSVHAGLAGRLAIKKGVNFPQNLSFHSPPTILHNTDHIVFDMASPDYEKAGDTVNDAAYDNVSGCKHWLGFQGLNPGQDHGINESRLILRIDELWPTCSAAEKQSIDKWVARWGPNCRPESQDAHEAGTEEFVR